MVTTGGGGPGGGAASAGVKVGGSVEPVPGVPAPPLATTVGLKFALGASVALTLAIGLYPEPFLKLAQTSLFR